MIKGNPTAINFEIQFNTNLYVVMPPWLDIVSPKSLTFRRFATRMGVLLPTGTRRSNIVAQPAN